MFDIPITHQIFAMTKTLQLRFRNSVQLTWIFFAIAILFLSSTAAMGQGTLKGVIKDKVSDDPLIASTVVVKGTTTGTVSDYNGEYTLVLKAGTYTMEVSYIGYATVEETITLEDGQTTELNVGLAPEAIMGEEAVVTMQARGQLAAVNQQLRANQIVNVVSAERIKELPDQNAAQAVSRLPGISLSGSQVVIRGIQPKMNKIMINGVEMPSTEANNRASSIGMVSANMLSGIEVYKTLTPDMDADAIGGVVNLTLREAPTGLHYNAMVQGTYNAQEKYMGNYRFWGDISNRFFNDKFGAALSFNYDKAKGGDDELSNDFYPLSQGTLGTADYLLNGIETSDSRTSAESFGGSLILDYKLPKGKFIFSSMFNHTVPESTKYIDNMNFERYRREFNMERSKYTSLLLNNSLRYEQQIGIVKLNASASYISMDREDEYRYSYRFRSESDAYYPDSLTNARLLVMEPHEAYGAVRPGFEENMTHSSLGWSPRSYNENQFIADLDLEIPLRISDQVSAKITTGGKYRKMERAYDNSSARYGDDIGPEPQQLPMADFLASIGHENGPGSEIRFPTVNDPNFSTNDNFLNSDGQFYIPYAMNVDYMDHMALDLLDPNTLQGGPDMWRGDYWGGEELTAAYLMAEFNFWARLNVIAGVRYESLKNDYVAMEVANVSKNAYFIEDTISSPVTNSNLLPHLHLRFKATDWWDIRFSYNETMSRPDYNYAIPSIYYDQVGGTGRAGNPNIKPAVSKNLDANFTFYSRKLGLVTIGGFMKRIEDVFYAQPTLIANIPDSTIRNRFPLEEFPTLAQGTSDFYINNPNDAYIRGLEVEWQSNLTYLRAPFNGLVFNVNYTHIWSETSYPQHRVSNNFIPTFPYFELVENDTVYTDRLLHQGNDIANVSLGYDYKGFSCRFSFRFQGNVITTVASRPEENRYTNNVYKFDFVAKQQIPIKSAKLEVFFNAMNFTNVPYRRYSIFPNRGETNILTRYSGARFQLGIRFTK